MLLSQLLFLSQEDRPGPVSSRAHWWFLAYADLTDLDCFSLIHSYSAKFVICLGSKTHAFCLAGAQSDSEVSSYHPSDMSLDRGYTSDSEVYTDHGKPGKMHRSVTDVDVMNSGWLVVSSQ